MEWILHDDGSFDLITPTIQLKRCYPSKDGAAIRPLQVAAQRSSDGGEIRYVIPMGEVLLRFIRSNGGLRLCTSLRGWQRAPHWFAPLTAGQVQGADRFFRQGLGIGGPTGFIRLDDSSVEDPVESYTICALIGSDSSTLTAYCVDHRRFIQRSSLLLDSPKSVEVGFRTEGIPLGGDELSLPELHFQCGEDPWYMLRTAAQSIGTEMEARTHLPTSFHWCSWYYLYHNLTEDLLREYVEAFAKLEPSPVVQTIQIDAGYFPSTGDWLLTTPYWPSGLETSFHRIQEAGFRVGIWVAPYMVGNRSQLYQDHPEWILLQRDGTPVTPWRQYNEPKPWGYRDEEYYVLDTSNPEAMDHMREVFRIFKGWGAEFFKTDFMLWGLQDSIQVRRHSPGRTSVEYFRGLLQVIREEIGEESFWLGCIAPYAPFLGYADGMRIGADVGALWSAEQLFTPTNMIRETQGTQYFNNVWWQNDPDAVMLRDFHIYLSETEIRSLALWQGILGGVSNTSAPLHEIAPDRLDLWRFLEPGQEKWTANLPYFSEEKKILVAVRSFEGQEAWALLAFNPGEEKYTECIRLEEVIGLEEACCYEWSPAGSTLLGQRTHLVLEIEPHDSMLFYLARDEKPPILGLTLGGMVRS